MIGISDADAGAAMRTWALLLALLGTAGTAAAGIDNHRLEARERVTLVFESAGLVHYHCTPHPNMRGTVRVEEGGPANATVGMQNLRFSPETVSVAVGGNVTFLNDDIVLHTVTAIPAEGSNALPFPGLAALFLILALALWRR